MLDSGGTRPSNYHWRCGHGRVLCLTRDREFVMDVPRPVTLRHALLEGYLAGWCYAADAHHAHIRALERQLRG